VRRRDARADRGRDDRQVHGEPGERDRVGERRRRRHVPVERRRREQDLREVEAERAEHRRERAGRAAAQDERHAVGRRAHLHELPVAEVRGDDDEVRPHRSPHEPRQPQRRHEDRDRDGRLLVESRHAGEGEREGEVAVEALRPQREEHRRERARGRRHVAAARDERDRLRLRGVDGPEQGGDERCSPVAEQAPQHEQQQDRRRHVPEQRVQVEGERVHAEQRAVEGELDRPQGAHDPAGRDGVDGRRVREEPQPRLGVLHVRIGHDEAVVVEHEPARQRPREREERRRRDDPRGAPARETAARRGGGVGHRGSIARPPPP
jgi:hypothetical protein